MTATTMMNPETEPGVRVEVDKHGTDYRRDDNCEKHGPFENRAYLMKFYAAAGNPIRWAGCPKCAEEQKAERERRERDEMVRKLLEERLADRIARANIPSRFSDATLENYTATNVGQQRALETAKGYAADFSETWQRGQSLLLLGNIGTGKTHLAVGIASQAIEQGAEVIFTTTADMIGRVKATWGQRGGDPEAQVIQRYADVDLLVLDEVGSIKCSGREREILFAVLGGRHNAVLPTIFTGNVTADELPGYLGDQIMSRLREGGSQTVIFGWGDYRPIMGKQAMVNKSMTTD